MLDAVVQFLFPPQCGGCDATGTGLCVRCLPGDAGCVVPSKTLCVRALARYEGVVRRAVLSLKSGRRDVARAMGRRLAPIVPPGAVLVPVPTTAARRRVRGFDGGVLLAQVAAHHAGSAVADVLRQVAGDAQRGRSRGQRLAAAGRFVCATPLRGEHVLVDDVMTTGATLEDCARALRAAGATVTQALVVATAPAPDGSWSS